MRLCGIAGGGYGEGYGGGDGEGDGGGESEVHPPKRRLRVIKVRYSSKSSSVTDDVRSSILKIAYFSAAVGLSRYHVPPATT